RFGGRPVGQYSRSGIYRGACERIVPMRTQFAEELGVGIRLEFDKSLVDSAAIGDEHRHHTTLRDRDELDMPYPSAAQTRILDECDLLGEAGEKPHRATQKFVEIGCAPQKCFDRLLLSG